MEKFEFEKNKKSENRNFRKIDIFEIFDFLKIFGKFQTQISPRVLNIFSKIRMRWRAMSLLYRYVMSKHHSLTIEVVWSGL